MAYLVGPAALEPGASGYFWACGLAVVSSLMIPASLGTKFDFDIFLVVIRSPHFTLRNAVYLRASWDDVPTHFVTKAALTGFAAHTTKPCIKRYASQTLRTRKSNPTRQIFNGTTIFAVTTGCIRDARHRKIS